MVVPVLAGIAATTAGRTVLIGGLSAIGGFVVSSLFGQKKQEASTTQAIPQQQPIIVQPYIVQPNVQNTYQYDYSSQNMTNSPYSSQKKGSMGISAVLEPTQSIPFAVSPMQTARQDSSTSQGQGTDFTTVALVAAAGLVIYGMTQKGK